MARTKGINKVQAAEFRLIELASFNGFDGKATVASLKEHRELWRGAIMDSADYCFHSDRERGQIHIDLNKLRDIERGEWNVDTLYILPADGQEDALYTLAAEWEPDELDWIDKKTAMRLLGDTFLSSYTSDKVLLRAWWD